MRYFVFILLLLCASITEAAEVTLAWDENDPVPEGYRVFVREEGYTYNYDLPLWGGSDTQVTLTVDCGTTWYFVVRAYEGNLESADSEEVSWIAPDCESSLATQGFSIKWVEILDIPGETDEKTYYPVGTLPDGSLLYIIRGESH